MELPVNVTVPLSISTGLEHSTAGKTDANCTLEMNQSLIHKGNKKNTINSGVQVQVLLFGDCAFSWHRLCEVLFNKDKYMFGFDSHFFDFTVLCDCHSNVSGLSLH